jgi:hypothetical protein
MYPKQYEPAFPAYQQEPTITVKQHQEAIQRHNKDLLLIVSLVTLAIVAIWQWREKRSGGGSNRRTGTEP